MNALPNVRDRLGNAGSYARAGVAAFFVLASAATGARAADAPTAVAAPQPTVSVAPLSDVQLKDPKLAFAAMRKFVGGEAWQKVGSLFVTGFAQLQGQSLPFTSAADTHTGYNRSIVLLPHNGGTYEFGIDKDGGWTAVGGKLRVVAVSPENLATARYVDRFGFLDGSQAVALKEVGVDATIGDRISATPAGGAPFVVVVKPATTLPSAIQFANGQLRVYGDYRPVSGVYFPYRVMQGADPKAMSVFTATIVELAASSPDSVAVTRPNLPIDTSTPAPLPASSASK